MQAVPYVVIFIPAYNEEKSIGGVIKKINDLYGNEKKIGFRTKILVVDDGSTDKTVEVASQMGVSIVSHPQNRGLGASTRTGLQRAFELGADIAVKIDADFQHDPDDVFKVTKPIIGDKADVVFGSRFMGEIEYKMPFYRRAGNLFFSYLVSKLTGLKITDGQTGLMAFSKNYLAKFNIISDYNETQQLIIDSWKNHMRILEVPVVFHKRTEGTSFISFKYPFKVLPTLLRLLVQVKPLNIFLPLGLIFILAGIVLCYFVVTNKVQFFGDASIVMLIMGGIQIIIFGLLADAISKRR
ncbi:glycosyltransferase family 2 protein [Candidatus Omnitrophota bacterium]